MSGLGDFFVEGGWGMVPTLVFGVITVGGAIWFALAPEPRRLAFTAAMWLTLASAIVHATWTNLASVMAYIEDPAKTPDGAIARTLVTGLKESSRPGALGGLFLTLALLVVAIGAIRSPRRD